MWEWQSIDNDVVNIWQDGDGIHLQLYRWDDECFFNIDTPWAVPSLGDLAEVQDGLLRLNFGVGNSIEFDRKSPSQPEESFIQNEKGGVEILINLGAKPASNIFEFPISHQGLNFYYQPELTPEELGEGGHQFERAIGSYAIYHSTRSNVHSNQADSDKYKCGKAFHLHRHRITDSKPGKPKWAWIDLNITNDLMTLTIPQDFLDNAIYPVIIDPNFGYETQGTAGYMDCEGYILGDKFLNNQGAGDGDSISACLYINNQNLKCALYDEGTTANYIQTTDERSDITEKAKAFYTFNFSTQPEIVNNTTYNLACWGGQTGGGGYGRIYYDLTEGVVGPGDLEAYNGWPATILANSYADRTFSIYCTFTAGEAPPTYVPKVIMIT